MNKLCKCGYDKYHEKVIHKSEYTKWGWFLFTILGLSAKPKVIKFVCSECEEITSITTNPEILSKYVGR